jgi:hypothetical protein
LGRRTSNVLEHLPEVSVQRSVNLLEGIFGGGVDRDV